MLPSATLNQNKTQFSGLKLQRDSKTGKVTIDPKQKRNSKRTSYAFARELGKAIGNEKVSVSIHTVSESKNNVEVIGDRHIDNKLDIDDYNVFKRDAPEFAARFLTHVVTEYYEAQLQGLRAGLIPGNNEFHPAQLHKSSAEVL